MLCTCIQLWNQYRVIAKNEAFGRQAQQRLVGSEVSLHIIPHPGEQSCVSSARDFSSYALNYAIQFTYTN
jgi:hypothetical protein